jgi:aryl-alcohol dehydrogenase-like predicted oxidoreductase
MRRGQPLPAVTRLNSRENLEVGPPVEEEFVYAVVDAIDAVAQETGRTVAQIALNWVLQRPSVATVIIGARNEAQLRENLGAIGWALTPAQMQRLDAASARTAAYPYWHQRKFEERNPFPTRW